MKKAVGLILPMFLVIVVGFQNCAGFSGEVPSGGNLSLLSVEEPLQLKTQPAVKGQPITITVDTNRYAAGSSFLWDHVFGSGLEFCEQSASLDRSTLVLLCPSSGTVKLTLEVTTPSGETTLERLEFVVLDVGGTAPAPTPPPVTVKTGLELYQQNCSGCHGNYSESTKRRITMSRLNGAIAANTGGMGSLSSLSTSDREKIVDALK